MFKTVSILVDNDSWILPYAENLADLLTENNYISFVYRVAEAIPLGDICFMLGCTKIVPNEILALNKYNLVIHESDLPQGKGFAPMTWQILEGRKHIPVCLIEAASEVDSGRIWLRENIDLDGTELCADWRRKQGEISVQLAYRFVKEFKSLTPETQTGNSSFYSRRKPSHSKLDINKTIEEQFNLMRVVDSKRYPAFFEINGTKYKIEISRDE